MQPMKRKRKWRAKLVPPSTDPVVTKLTSGYHEVFSGLGNHNSIKAKRCAPHQRRLHCFWQSNEDNDKALENLLRRFPERGLTFNLKNACSAYLRYNSLVSSSRKMELSYHWPNFAEMTTPYATSPNKELNGDGHKPREQHSKNSSKITGSNDT